MRFLPAGLVALLALAACPAADAHRWYTMSYPNADRVPAPAGVDTKGSPYCLAPGHNNCIRGGTNQFGDDWSDTWANYALLDSDGDGYSNAEELGCPCVDWSHGTRPRFTEAPSNPGWASSLPSHAPCLPSSAHASAPTGLRVERADAGLRTELRWEDAAGLDNRCLCRYEVRVTRGAAAAEETIVVDASAGASGLVLCGLEAGQAVRVTVRGLKGRAETLASAELSFTAAAGAAATLECSAESPRPPADATVWTAGLRYDLLAYVGAFVAVLAVTALLHAARDTRSKARNLCLHWRRGRGLSLEQAFIGGAALGAAYAAFQFWVDYNDEMVYSWGGRSSVGRGVGRAAMVFYFAAVLPVARHSLWLKTSGVSLDRTVKYHRWFSVLFVWAVVAHGVLVTLSYEDGGVWGWEVIFTLGEEYNTWPGTLSGVLFLVMAFAALKPFRRRFYTFFKSMHIVLFVVASFFMVVHVPEVLLYAAPAVLLWLADYVLLLGDGALRPTTVLAAVRFGSSDGAEEPADRDPLTPARVLDLADEQRRKNKGISGFGLLCQLHRIRGALRELRAPRPPAPAEDAAPARGRTFQFLRLTVHKTGYSHRAGQFMYFWVPSISRVPHPYSIMTAPPPEGADVPADTVDVVVKSMGPGTWSDRLINHPGWVPDPVTGALRNSFRLVMVAACGSPAVQFARYEEVVLVAGGVGITPMASTFSELLQLATEDKTTKQRRSVQLVWAYRDEPLAREVVDRLAFQQRLLAGAEARAEEGGGGGQLQLPPGFRLSLFSTGAKKGPSHEVRVKPRPATEAEEPDGVEMSAMGATAEKVRGKSAVEEAPGEVPEGLSTDKGRPNVFQMLRQARDRAIAAGVRRVAVGVCGPAPMHRAALRAATQLSTSKCTFDVHEENFEW